MRVRGPAHCSVWVDGEEVTKRCFLADDETGEVGLYLLRDGRPYVEEGGEIARETRFGEVRIEFPREWERIKAGLAGLIE